VFEDVDIIIGEGAWQHILREVSLACPSPVLYPWRGSETPGRERKLGSRTKDGWHLLAEFRKRRTLVGVGVHVAMPGLAVE
jgi:hypothetical protein